MPLIQSIILSIHENKLVATIVVILFIAFVIYEAWPNMQSNNIFMPKLSNYGKPERKMYGFFSPWQTFMACFALNIWEIALWIYRAVNPVILVAGQHRDRNAYHPGILFFLSLFGMFVIFIYSFVEDVDFEPVHNFKYALKIWITSIIVTPMVMLVFNADKIIGTNYGPYLYIKAVVLTSGFGCIALATLIGITHYVSLKTWHMRKKRLFIFVTVQIAVAINMFAAAPLIQPGVSWFACWPTYAAIIGLTICTYRLDKTIYTDVVFYEAEVVE